MWQIKKIMGTALKVMLKNDPHTVWYGNQQNAIKGSFPSKGKNNTIYRSSTYYIVTKVPDSDMENVAKLVRFLDQQGICPLLKDRIEEVMSKARNQYDSNDVNLINLLTGFKIRGITEGRLIGHLGLTKVHPKIINKMNDLAEDQPDLVSGQVSLVTGIVNETGLATLYYAALDALLGNNTGDDEDDENEEDLDDEDMDDDDGE